MAKALEPRNRCRSLGEHSKSNASNLEHMIPKIFCLENLNDVDLFDITIERLQKHLSDYDFTSLELVNSCLKRIRNVGLAISHL